MYIVLTVLCCVHDCPTPCIGTLYIDAEDLTNQRITYTDTQDLVRMPRRDCVGYIELALQMLTLS